ncbi:putative odorant receptor 92a [Chelonus insularis]|uniref:putative odorant receptor 92a n=1 Tax=Chelonus insularis TaxID=460826 RepID=UPI00158B0EC4|nr:putative odorant receptor 92a [Chelonus insularis]
MLVQYKAKLGRNICIYQLGSTYFVLFPMIIGALPIFVPSDNSTFNESEPVLRSFPIQTPYMFSNISDWCYILVFILQIFQLFSTVTGNVGVDCCFFDEGIILNNFSSIVQQHNRLIKLAEYLEEIFNFIIFCIVGSNVAQICFYGIQLLRSLRHGNSVIAINSTLCIVILSFQIFLYSWAGDQLSSAFESFKFSSFNCGWDEMPLKFKKNLVFIMMRTHRQFNLTAGSVYRMDLDNFKNIMKAIGSYFSVMRTMFES